MACSELMKSFTDLDIILHFLLMDLLDEEDGLTLSGIQDALDSEVLYAL